MPGNTALIVASPNAETGRPGKSREQSPSSSCVGKMLCRRHEPDTIIDQMDVSCPEWRRWSMAEHCSLSVHQMFTKRPELVGCGGNGSDVEKRGTALDAAILLRNVEVCG